MGYSSAFADLRAYPSSEEIPPDEFLSKLAAPEEFKIFKGAGGAASRIEFFISHVR
jgi:hypothetical protein